jgi:large subunit ribosomal protein L6
MSRIGKKPIKVPENVEVVINDGGVLKVRGPLGELERRLRNDLIKVSVENDAVKLEPVGSKRSGEILALWGTYASHVRNMIEGVTKGFSKTLIIEGIGFKAQLQGNELVLSLGYSHPVKKLIPAGVKVGVEKNKIEVRGSDKELVGRVAAEIRALKKPEPYKGKGIRYSDEIIRRKAGKKAVTAA